MFVVRKEFNLPGRATAAAAAAAVFLAKNQKQRVEVIECRYRWRKRYIVQILFAG